MRTAEERIKRMHNRTEELRKKHEKRVLTGIGTLSAFLCFVLIAFSVYTIGTPGAITDAAMAGSSMLADSAGGYVLVAVISFTVAVLATAFCLKTQMKKKGNLQDDAENGRDSNKL